MAKGGSKSSSAKGGSGGSGGSAVKGHTIAAKAKAKALLSKKS